MSKMNPFISFCFFFLVQHSFADGACKYKNLAFIIDSTKHVKPIEFDDQRAKTHLSILLGKLKGKHYSNRWHGRVYHDNNDCNRTRDLDKTEHFGPVEGNGIIRGAIKELKHYSSNDTFKLSCAEELLFKDYDDLNVGLIIVPYDTMKEEFDKPGMYGYYVYHEKIRKQLILLHDAKEQDEKITEILNELIGFICPTHPPPTPSIAITPTPTPTETPTPKPSSSASTISQHTPALTKTSSVVVSTNTTGSTSVSTAQMTSTSTFHSSTSLRAVTTPTPTTGKPSPSPTPTESPEDKLIHEIEKFMLTDVEQFDKQKSENFVDSGMRLLQKIYLLHIQEETPVKLMDFFKTKFFRIGELLKANDTINLKIDHIGAVVLSNEGKDFQGVNYEDEGSKFSIAKSFFGSKHSTADAPKSIVAIMEYPTLPAMTALKRTDKGEDVSTISFLCVAQYSSRVKKVTSAVQKKISYTLHIRKGVSTDSKYQCVFWEKSSPSNGSWNDKGCEFKSIKEQNVTCECDYKATIGYSVMRLKPTSTRFCLKFSTYIGCAVAGGVCLIIVMLLVMFRKGLKYDQNVVHLNLALSIAVSNGLYIAANFAYKLKYVCMGVSIGIMYFYLATLFWILVESFHLYMLIVRKAKDTNMTMFYMILGWVAPSIIVALTAALQRQYFLKEEFCWLTYDNWVIWTLVGPSCFIILLSVIFLALSLKSSFKLERSLAGVVKFQRITKFLFALIPLIGLCWSAALLAVNEQEKYYYQYALTGINGAIALLGLLSLCFLSSSNKGAMNTARSTSSVGKDNKANDTSTLSLSVITEPAFHSKTNF